MNYFKISLVLLGALMLTSCGLKPIPSEYTFAKTNLQSVQSDDLGEGNVLIYNGANLFHTMDNTARLNVWLNDKSVGQIKPKEYLIINLEEGTYRFDLLHKDVINMKSQHEVQIDNKTKVIMIKPTVTSNDLEVTNTLPKNFEKFIYVQQQ